ncbi:DNA polymerase III subunit delta' [Tautonia marina]|uniref:DNA polymerase III subunit delta' n=1 Tax=Tautonia marina TaxID=2653855 RepID=UPI00126081FF|nr:DNA polymerase III subunit delta' [Tautonia marina]
MSWGSVRGHDRVVDDLRRAASSGRFPHALLFVGPEGIGKRTFARRLAQALFCERQAEGLLDPCGECASCRQVVSGDHPDLHEVGRPEDKHELPIAVIRDLCHDLSLKPMRGTRKVAIVDDADHFNEEAANAFLKTLEEPPDGAVLILIGTSSELQLDTILSRCRVVRFDPLPEAELAAILRDRDPEADPSEADRLARLGEGSVSRALSLADPELTSFRRRLVDELADARPLDAPDLARRLEEFIKDAGKESLVQRTRAAAIFGELARFFRVVLWQGAGLDPPAPDPSDRRAAAALADRLEPEDVYLLVERCLEADYHLRRRVYLPLLVDALARDLGRLLSGLR